MLIHQSHPQHQRGAALVTGLLIMMVMTLIGIAGMQSSIIQTNLATNAQLNTIGFQTAEAVLANASSYTYLSKSLEKPAGTATNIPPGTQNISLNTGTKAAVETSGDVTYCGTLPPSLATGLSLDANQSINNNTYTRYVFDLTAKTDVEKSGRVQATAQHSQRSSRLMLNKQGAPMCTI